MSPKAHTVTTAIVVLAVGLAAHALSFVSTQVRPPETVLLEITRGSGSWQISRTLEEKGVVSDAPTFMALALATGKARRLQAGIYVFEGAHRPLEVMDILFMGKTLRHRVTIPEGYTIFQIAHAVAQTGVMERDAFLAKARDPQTASFFGIDAPSMEGFLFPDTYFLVPRSTPLEVMAKMVGRFKQVYTQEMEERARTLGLSMREAVTLASLIEKEAKVAHEKPLVSSVFHNRLRRGIRLQSDPTAIYGIDGFTGRIRHVDLLRESPYNTYLHKGLPPGPICNPGEDSLKAALWPARSNYLYFFARGDGTHVFSATIEEHNRAISGITGPRGGRPLF